MTLRRLALVLGLFAFAGRVAYTFWLQPLSWSLNTFTWLQLFVASYVLSAAIPVTIFTLVTPLAAAAQLERRGTALVAPPSPNLVGLAVICLGFFGGGLIVAERVPDADAMRVAHFDWAWPITLVSIGLTRATALALVLIQRPRIEFTADALTIRRLWRVIRLEWDRLAPGGPLPPKSRSDRHMLLYLADPPLPGRYPTSVAIAFGWLYVDPKFIADTIRRYAEHPEERAALPGAGKPQRAPSI